MPVDVERLAQQERQPRTRIRAFVFLVCQLLFMGQAPSASAFEDVSFEASSNYKGKAIRLKGELLQPPAKEKHPAVVLMHGCGGWQPPVHASLRKHARYLAQHGFIALNCPTPAPVRQT
jgi:poly(3-hydroxybutyrate) depolymerase